MFQRTEGKILFEGFQLTLTNDSETAVFYCTVQDVRKKIRWIRLEAAGAQAAYEMIYSLRISFGFRGQGIHLCSHFLKEVSVTPQFSMLVYSYSIKYNYMQKLQLSITFRCIHVLIVIMWCLQCISKIT